MLLPDFTAQQARCEADSALIASVIDNFLLQYCDYQEKLLPRIAREFAGYTHVLEQMPEGWEGYIISQLIAHTLFRKRGLASRYITHDAVRKRSPDELAFLVEQIDQPWQWRFAVLKEKLDGDFYEMEDACTGERYVLYSHSMKDILSSGPPLSLFFMLTLRSGDARMIFGPITYFQSLFPDDLLSLARLIDPQIRSLQHVPDVIDANPLPFLMFWLYGDAPQLVYKDDIPVHHFWQRQKFDFTPSDHGRHFKVESRDNIWHLTLKRWGGPPHFAEVFYDTGKRHLMVQAMTPRAWEKLVTTLNECGVPVSPEPQRRLGMTAHLIAKEVLRRPPITESYAGLFTPPVSVAEQDALDGINRFLDAYMTEMNAGRLVDIKAMADACGLDYDVAEQIIVNIAQKLK